ncbi:raftlin [Aquila chrysaetos chrysaetos]|uniref:Raftlin, lipid raft linker 1 n=1 Tax=Aquila chrysaetos chrysaetos TaxID=223781 RepID=A0A663F2A5_AQUCH|nr:raftlin [Aquila chrysaetos chrysaetos]XP_029865819.1 raftlin [Aquila chrysaetos chrysaetos]XP_029865820.1 raftlin [Aquila chrysaetos chrysaetos]
MGCGLNKLEKHDEKRPGNIYSTLKRPQVETKIDVCYEYQFLDFTTLNDTELPGSSAIKLSSLRDLPAQLQELYQQGFVLAAVHPFVQPTDEKEKTPQEQIFRAVLIKKTERSPKGDVHSEGYVLEVECCSSVNQLSDKKEIPDFIKKIQDAASQGLKFVGIIPQYHSQKSCLVNASLTPASNNSVQSRDNKNVSNYPEDHASLDGEKIDGINGCNTPAPSEESADQCATSREGWRGEGQATEELNLKSAKGNEEQFQHANPSVREAADKPNGLAENETPAQCLKPLTGKAEIFTLFNKPKTPQRCSRYYTVTIPMRISRNGQTVSSLEANWLEHMTDHFRKGGSLVNAIFGLGMVNDSLHGTMDGVFLFEDVAVEDSKTVQGYDAIVVEQWTVLKGVEVQTDYVPLLNSLAVYGWQLTCVLPTPIVKTNREGNLSTKQIVFLQRPSLPQKAKKKESKFHWRFSKEDMHNKHMKKSMKTKLSTREKQMAEEKQEFEVTENTRNLEAQILTVAKPDPEEQLDDVIDLGDEVAGTNDRGTHRDGASEETCPASYDTDDNDVQVCLSQSTSGCCVDQVTEGGDCAPVSDSCNGSSGAGLDMDCSCE